MSQETTIINEFTGKDYLNATGLIEIGMTNDYMFRVVFQRNKYALKGLICSILHMNPDSVKKIDITNEIKPGESISDREYRMDILVTLNDDTLIDIEMQLKNYGNWKHRSLSYLCREFDNLDHGDDYEKVRPAYQIGFLDFTLFEEHPEFCATYQMRNAKDNFLYTDRFNLIVIELNQEKLATKEDISYGITDWVRLFNSKTWEELKMVAQNNDYMTSTIESMYLSNVDKNVLKVAREREEFLRSQAYKDERLKNQAQVIEQQANEIEQQANEIERLRKLLEANDIDAGK